MTAHPVDIHVGKKVRARRKMLGLSQDDLGKSIGVTFQQVQKYERGTNRVGSSRLYELSKVLSVPVGFFFDGFSAEQKNSEEYSFAEDEQAFERDASNNKETMSLVQSYYRIKDPAIRNKMLGLIKALRTEEDASSNA